MHSRNLVLATALLFGTALAADTTTVPASGMARRFLRLTADPATCREGDVWENLTTGLFKGCTDVNTIGVFTIGGITQAAADLRYLKLAADNDPLTGALTGVAGTAALPSFSFTGEADTGMYLFGANSIGFPVGGVDKWVMSSSGGLNCATDGGCDIGNGLADPRDLSLQRNLILRGSTSGTVTFSAPAIAGSTSIVTDTLLVSGGALGTPSSGVATNLTGTASGLTAGLSTALTTARTINGDSFDGTANIQNTLASADFANQGTTTTLLHGNAAGDPSFGAVVDADLSLTTPVLGAPTATTVQTSGNVGIGTTPNATTGRVLDLLKTGNHATILDVANMDAAGIASAARISVTADAAQMAARAYGTGNTSTIFGVTTGGYTSLLAGTGNGLLVGTVGAVPVLIGTGGVSRINIAGTGNVSLPLMATTAGTMTGTHEAVLGSVTTCRSWTNAQVAALAGTAGDIAWGTLSAKTTVLRVVVIITGAAVGPTTVTVSVGRTSTTYIDYIVASDAKAAANTVYGDGAAERGTNYPVSYDLPSYTATTLINAHFISTGADLSTTTGSTGLVCITTDKLP